MKQIVVLAAEGQIAVRVGVVVVETSSVLGTVKMVIEGVDRSSSQEANRLGPMALTAARAFPLERQSAGRRSIAYRDLEVLRSTGSVPMKLRECGYRRAYPRGYHPLKLIVVVLEASIRTLELAAGLPRNPQTVERVRVDLELLASEWREVRRTGRVDERRHQWVLNRLVGVVDPAFRVGEDRLSMLGLARSESVGTDPSTCRRGDLDVENSSDLDRCRRRDSEFQAEVLLCRGRNLFVPCTPSALGCSF